MSGQYSTKGTPAAPAGVGHKKPGSQTTNGSGPPPLTYAEPEDDENMNEIVDDDVDVTVYLPDGSLRKQTVESNTPMMDLLVNLAAKSRLSPASHTLVVLTNDKWKQIDFKANKTIGLLAGEDRTMSVQIVPKKQEDKGKVKGAVQPFEMTYRLTVNLPHNQRKVLRISPKLSLGQVRALICEDKTYDPTRYIFQLPSNPGEKLSDQVIIGDLRTAEINFLNTALLESSMKSMPDLRQAQIPKTSTSSMRSNPETSYMPMAGEKKSKRGFLSFLGKKDKNKFKVTVQQRMAMDLESGQAGRRSSNGAVARQKENEQHARPKTMYAVSPADLEAAVEMRRTTTEARPGKDIKTDFRRSTGTALMTVEENRSKQIVQETIPENSQVPVKKGGKKRAAPPPPKVSNNAPQSVQVEIKVEPHKQNDVSRIEDVGEMRVPSKTTKFHSRNSSDSSGYHELTLSGADSPDGVKVTDMSKTSLDTTSIDSGEHFNGENAVRDLSPSRRQNVLRDKSPREEKGGEGRKKRRAPPPPGASAPVTKVEAKSEQKPTGAVKDDEDEALLAMEVVTMEFDRIAEDDNMRMVEDVSIRSEDIDIEKEKSRPPQFIAPPPPSEPPPPESEPVDYDAVVNHINTHDIGVGDDTTSIGPGSTKSSPVSMSSRPSSRSSTSSVNTLEDLSLAFKLTIAMGEEALESETLNDNVEDELKASMQEFKEKISTLSSENASGTQSGNTTGRSQGSDVATDSDASFVVHGDIHVAKETASEASSLDNFEMREKSPGRDSPMIGQRQERESEEITYEFTIDSVPPEFQSMGEEQQESSDEENVEVVTEEVVTYKKHPASLEMGSPRRIPDLDSPKEHRSFSLPVRELFSEIPVDVSTPKAGAGKPSQAVVEPEVVEVTEEEVVEEKPPEKEEFEISLDDLRNIDFSTGGKKPEIVKKEEKIEEQPYNVDYLNEDEFRAEDVIVVDSMDEKSFDNDDELSDRGEVKNKCSELSFSPGTEAEMEHVMEEKSISMIAHPVERNAVQSPEDSEVVSFQTEHPTYSSSTKIVLSTGNVSSEPDRNAPSPSRTDADVQQESSDTQSLDKQQYQQLQQQFLMWQSQLAQNQRLLANQTPTPTSANQVVGVGPVVAMDDQSQQIQQLNMQIQLQQQMMLQLQQNMQAMALQNAWVAQQPLLQASQQAYIVPQAVPDVSSVRRDSNPPQVVMSSVPAPPPAPPVAPAPPQVAAKPKAKAADAKYTKPKPKRFETKLEPREKLMLDIRNYRKNGLKKVPVKATHWHNA